MPRQREARSVGFEGRVACGGTAAITRMCAPCRQAGRIGPPGLAYMVRVRNLARRTDMRPSLRMFLAVTAGATVTVMAGTQPSRADVAYPWCAEYSMQGSSNCGFVTYQQCMAALSG